MVLGVNWRLLLFAFLGPFLGAAAVVGDDNGREQGFGIAGLCDEFLLNRSRGAWHDDYIAVAFVEHCVVNVANIAQSRVCCVGVVILFVAGSFHRCSEIEARPRLEIELGLSKVAVGANDLRAKRSINVGGDSGGIFAALPLAACYDDDRIFRVLDRRYRGKQADPSSFTDARTGLAGDAGRTRPSGPV